MKNDQIDELDQKILSLISENARIPFLEVARECNVSGAAIHQRIAKLIETGVIVGSQYTLDWAKIGYETCAIVSACIMQPTCLKSLIEEIRKIPEIVECHFSSGRYDIVIKVIVKNNKELLDLVQEKLYPMGFSSLETMILFEEVIRRSGPADF